MITVKELCADFKNHHRKRLAPKRYDCNATTQAEFTMHLFYRKEFKMVLDTLLKLTNDNLKSCISSIQPFFVDIIKEHSKNIIKYLILCNICLLTTMHVVCR